MNTTKRRTVLKALVALPFVASAVELFSGGEAHAHVLTPAEMQRARGVAFLRLAGTLQLRYQTIHQRYARSLGELFGSGALPKLMSEPHAEKMGIGPTFLSSIRLSEPAMLPDWHLEFRERPAGEGYLLTARHLTIKEVPALAIDGQA